MAYKCVLAHFVHDENGRSHGGLPGDQTGQESCRRAWYLIKGSEWTEVFRPKLASVAERIAQAMEDLCDNECIGGYDQWDRTSAFEAAKAAGWNIRSVTKKCNSDCSAAVALCINAAGIPISKDMYTGNEKQLIERTAQFKTLTQNKYLQMPDHLQRGDILRKKGHTTIVVSNDYELMQVWKYVPGAIMKGEDVVHIQAALNNYGNDLPCSDRYGKKTAAAVTKFQQAHGLTPDGVVGPYTAKALGFLWGK